MTIAERPGGRGGDVHRAPMAVVALVVALTAAQAVLIALSWGSAAANELYWRPASLVQALIGLEFAAVGGLIAVRRPENRVGWLLLCGGLGVGAYSFFWEYALRGAVLVPGSLPAAGFAAILSQTTWALPFSILPLVLLAFPNGRPLSRWWALAGWPAVLGATVLLVVGTAELWPLRFQGRALLLATDEQSDTQMSAVVVVGTLLLLTSVLPSVVHVVVRWRASRGVERLQMRWLVPSGLLLVLGSLVNGLLANGSAWGEVALLSGLFSLPAAVAMAVLRYRLYEIDRIISRVISYALVTGVLGAVYAAVVVVPSTVLRLDSNLLVAAATLAVAAGFVPVRRRIQTAVDRRFNRSGYDAGLVVEQFKTQTREQVDLDRLIDDLRDAVAAAVEPATAAVWLREPS